MEASLPVGDPARARSARALLTVSASATVFSVFAWSTTQLRPLRAQSPWQDDPFDLVVTFTLFAVPLLVALGFTRAQLCRRDEPLAANRLAGLLRAAWAVEALVGLTLAADWCAVALRADGGLWGGRTPVLIAALAAATLLCVAAAARLRTAGPAHTSGDDWLSDLQPLLRLLGARVPAARRPVARLEPLASALIVRPLRARPVATAAGAALAAGFVAAGELALREQQRVSLFVTEWLVFAAGVLALAAALNHALTLVPVRRARSPLTRSLRAGLVAGSAAVPPALGLRAELIGENAGLSQIDHLLLIAFAVGAVAGGVLSSRPRRASGRGS